MKKVDYDNFEEGFPDGIFAIPRDENEPLYNIRALLAYCEARGIEPDDLTEIEIKQFECNLG